MDIEKKAEGSKLTIALRGRLDTITAPQLEGELDLAGVEEVVFDIAGLDYVSSAGLRLFLTVQKTMAKQGRMTISGAQTVVREVFDMTGLSDVFNLV
jgi:anti-sigma B factor antagonist